MNETNKKIKYTYNLFSRIFYPISIDMLVHTQLKNHVFMNIKVTQTKHRST